MVDEFINIRHLEWKKIPFSQIDTGAGEPQHPQKPRFRW